MSKKSIVGAPVTAPVDLELNALNNQNLSSEELLAHIIDVVNYVLTYGQTPVNLQPILADNPAFMRLLGDFCATYQFALDLANGKLDSEYKIKGKIAGSLKSLQASLRHLSWQAQRISSGDYSQRVDFMGDFSSAFNSMVEKLREVREAEEQRANNLKSQKQLAIKSMLEAQLSRDESEKMNAQLKAQLEEIQNLQQLLREQAIRDQLTGLFNRRYLIETLERELARAERGKYPVSLIMIDLDHFKHLNDTYGHRVGDLVLESLGRILLEKTRLGDIPCRYGGEEIAIVFPNVDGKVTAKRAEYLRKEFQNSSINNAGLTIHATFSAGVASFPEHASDMDTLLQKADIALYSAKAAGRNNVVVYKPE